MAVCRMATCCREPMNTNVQENATFVAAKRIVTQITRLDFSQVILEFAEKFSSQLRPATRWNIKPSSELNLPCGVTQLVPWPQMIFVQIFFFSPHCTQSIQSLQDLKSISNMFDVSNLLGGGGLTEVPPTQQQPIRKEPTRNIGSRMSCAHL